MLQLENEQLFETGLGLIEQNLHIIDSFGIFDETVKLFFSIFCVKNIG